MDTTVDSQNSLNYSRLKFQKWVLATLYERFSAEVFSIFFQYFFSLGDLERLSRFWMIGTCKPNVQEKRASEPLSIAQFTSAFLLLLIGLGISMILLILEHLYMKHLQKHVQNSNSNGCCALVSRVSRF